MQTYRESRTETATIASGAAVSDAISNEFYNGVGVLHMPAAWTAASIGFQVSSEKEGTYQPLYDDNGNLVQVDAPTADNSYALPAGLEGTLFFKLWSQDGVGTDTNQGAEREIKIDLKT